jgi:hypothetical protein
MCIGSMESDCSASSCLIGRKSPSVGHVRFGRDGRFETGERRGLTADPAASG